MFVAKYTITNSILKNVSLSDAAKEVILATPLHPNWQSRLKKETFERIVHFGSLLEGSPLSLEETQEILDGREIDIPYVWVREVSKLNEVLSFVEKIYESIGPMTAYILTLETIFEIHRLITGSSEFRTRQLVIKNSKTGEISYSPPPAAEVPYLVEDLLNWINSDESQSIHPILKSGIVHFELSRIHPFTTGTGIISRAISLLLLYLDGYFLKKLFCLEEQFSLDPLKYHLNLQAVAKQKVLDTHERDLTPWLDYFTAIVSTEFNQVKDRVRRIASETQVKDALGESLDLNERQVLIMEYLRRHKSMRNSDFRKIFPDFSDDTVLRELRFLKKKNLIKKIGGTKKAEYVLES